jgi:CBS domain-containing protein
MHVMCGETSNAEKEGTNMTHVSPRIQTIKAALDDIGAAGEAARLQLHLLSMRARERTEELSTNIEALEERLDRGIEQAVQLAATKTRQFSSAIRESLGQPLVEPEARTNVQLFMTDRVCSCAADQTLNAAAQLMWDHDCGAVPVLDEQRRLVGIITDRDICMATYTQGLPPSAIRIGDIMARHVHTCSAGDSLERAAALMAEAQVRRLPVVDAERRLIGLISLADIARSAPVLGQRDAADLALQLVRAISQRQPDPQRASQ